MTPETLAADIPTALRMTEVSDPYDHWHTESCGKYSFLHPDGSRRSKPCDCGLDEAIATCRTEAISAERARIVAAVLEIHPDDYAEDDGDARTAVNILERVLDVVTLGLGDVDIGEGQ